jgi:hypothetical protein
MTLPPPPAQRPGRGDRQPAANSRVATGPNRPTVGPTAQRRQVAKDATGVWYAPRRDERSVSWRRMGGGGAAATAATAAELIRCLVLYI